MFQNKTHIKNVNIIDIETGYVSRGSSILVSHGVILKIGNFDSVKDPLIRIFDGRNGYCIPSFIDAHAHVTFDGRGHNQYPLFSYNEGEELSMARGIQNLTEAMLHGICLIRDLGAKGGKDKRLMSFLKKEGILCPELILSGEPLCIKGGHGYEFGKSLEDFKSIEHLIEDHISLNNEWLKVMNGPELFEAFSLKNIISHAHNKGLKVAVHAFTHEGIEAAIEACADTIEHALVYNERTRRLSVSNRTSFVPTYYCALVSLRDDFLATMPQVEIGYLEQWLSFLNNNFKYHVEHDFEVITGTDAGAAPCVFADITNEIKFFAQNGLSNLKALQSATITPAKILGRQDHFGSITEGKWANFIILKQNPLKNINAIDSMTSIWLKGVEILHKPQGNIYES